MPGVLVGAEAGSDRRDLEQHTARLAEVDRAEVEAVDDGGRIRARGQHSLMPALVLLRERGERHVVHAARALEGGLRGWRVVDVEAAATLPADLEATVLT